jgi:hypothetical protein
MLILKANQALGGGFPRKVALSARELTLSGLSGEVFCQGVFIHRIVLPLSTGYPEYLVNW